MPGRRATAITTALVVAVVTALSAPALASSRRGVSAAPTGSPSPSTVTVEVDGTTREALVHVPTSVAASARVPLVLHLHGGLGSPEHSIATTGLVETADRHGFVVAFPRGTRVGIDLPGDRAGYVWNAGRCCAVAARTGVDDVAFLRALVDHLVADFPVDPERVVMSGHSNGGMMAWRFACEAGGVLAAAMPVAASLETADPDTCRPRGTSLLAVHGDADRVHPIAGGRGGGISGVEFRAFDESVATYADASGCRPRPRVASRGDETVTTYRRCADGARARGVVLAGGDHPWPGGTGRGSGTGTGWSATDALVDLVAATAPPPSEDGTFAPSQGRR